MKDLSLEALAELVRNGSVFRVFLTRYPDIDGGGWFLDVDHGDLAQTRLLKRQGGLWVFETAEEAMDALCGCCYSGPLVVVEGPNGA